MAIIKQTGVERILRLLERIELRVAKLEENDHADVQDLPSSLAEGDLLIVDDTGAIIRLAIGSATEVLTVVSGRPEWA